MYIDDIDETSGGCLGEGQNAIRGGHQEVYWGNEEDDDLLGLALETCSLLGGDIDVDIFLRESADDLRRLRSLEEDLRSLTLEETGVTEEILVDWAEEFWTEFEEDWAGEDDPHTGETREGPLGRMKNKYDLEAGKLKCR